MTRPSGTPMYKVYAEDRELGIVERATNGGGVAAGIAGTLAKTYAMVKIYKYTGCNSGVVMYESIKTIQSTPLEEVLK